MYVSERVYRPSPTKVDARWLCPSSLMAPEAAKGSDNADNSSDRGTSSTSPAKHCGSSYALERCSLARLLACLLACLLDAMCVYCLSANNSLAAHTSAYKYTLSNSETKDSTSATNLVASSSNDDEERRAGRAAPRGGGGPVEGEQ